MQAILGVRGPFQQALEERGNGGRTHGLRILMGLPSANAASVSRSGLSETLTEAAPLDLQRAPDGRGPWAHPGDGGVTKGRAPSGHRAATGRTRRGATWRVPAGQSQSVPSSSAGRLGGGFAKGSRLRVSSAGETRMRSENQAAGVVARRKA